MKSLKFILIIILLNISFINATKKNKNVTYFKYKTIFKSRKKIEELEEKNKFAFELLNKLNSKLGYFPKSIDFNRIKYLIQNQTNLNLKLDDYTALMLAIKNKNKDIVKMLIDANAQVNETGKNETTALLLATYGGCENLEIVKLLIKANANIDARDICGKTPIMNAIYQGSKEMVLSLINAGADLNLKDEDGRTALIMAIARVDKFNTLKNENVYLQIFELLIKNKKINLFIKDNDGNSVFDISKKKDITVLNLILEKIKFKIFEAINLGDVQKLKEIIKAAPLGIYDAKKNNLLHLCINSLDLKDSLKKINDRIKIFELILQYKPDLLNQSNSDGHTPIELAAGRPIFFEVLKNIIPKNEINNLKVDEEDNEKAENKNLFCNCCTVV